MKEIHNREIKVLPVPDDPHKGEENINNFEWYIKQMYKQKYPTIPDSEIMADYVKRFPRHARKVMRFAWKQEKALRASFGDAHINKLFSDAQDTHVES